MCLCAFVSLDEDSLTCDFAETYHIYNWRSFPGRYIATLAVGLRQNSRIRMKASGVMADLDSSMLAMIRDDLETILYTLVKSRTRKHIAKPEYIAEKVIRGDTKQVQEYQGYDDSLDYEKAWERLSGNKHKEVVSNG